MNILKNTTIKLNLEKNLKNYWIIISDSGNFIL